MKINARKVVLASAVATLVGGLAVGGMALLGSSLSYKEFRLQDVRFTKFNNPYNIYNVALPLLMRACLFNVTTQPEQKVLLTVKKVNHLSLPSVYETNNTFLWDSQNFEHVHSRKLWETLSLLLRTGNMHCSDQAALAAKILGPDFELFRIRNVLGHTFEEILHDSRWIILDPQYDMRFRNKDGRLATFEDVRAYWDDDESLRIPEPLTNRTKIYLDKFRTDVEARKKPDFYKPKWAELQRLDYYLGHSVKEMTGLMELGGADIQARFVVEYLAFVRANVFAILENSPNPCETAAEVQDFFLSAIQAEYCPKYAEDFDGIFMARNYQALGRFDKALAELEKLPRTNQVELFTSQVLAEMGDAKAHAALAGALRNNTFYCYDAWRLSGEFVNPDDPERFKNFEFRCFDLDQSQAN